MSGHSHHHHAHDHHHGHDHVHGGGCQHGAGALDATALVSARGLRLVRGGRAILDGVDIDIRRGEIVTLIGPNGAGKTSLVRVLLGLEALTSGEIVRGRDLIVGYVPQRFDVDRALPMSVERFLSIGVKASAAHVTETLAAVGAAHLVARQLANLSGGELQRVLIARAVLRRPDLLVLDEPLRGVDHAGEAELYQLIGRLRDARGFAVLLISHDLHVVMASSDRVLCLNHHVCCSGVPEAVAQHPEYVRLFGPEAARTLAVYQHHHDHAHDLDGAMVAAPGGASSPPPSWGRPGGGDGRPVAGVGSSPTSHVGIPPTSDVGIPPTPNPSPRLGAAAPPAQGRGEPSRARGEGGT